MLINATKAAYSDVEQLPVYAAVAVTNVIQTWKGLFKSQTRLKFDVMKKVLPLPY